MSLKEKKIEIVYRFQDELVTAARLAEQIGKQNRRWLIIMARTRNRQMKTS